MAFRPTLNDYRSVGDPLIAADFLLLIPSIPGAADSRKISYKVVSTALPGTAIEQVPVEIGARKHNFAGRRTYSGTWSATLIETADASTRGDILNWISLARPYASGAGSYKNFYARTAELQVFDAANKMTISSVITGLFPLSLEDFTLEQSSNVIQYSVQFSFDEATETYGGS